MTDETAEAVTEAIHDALADGTIAGLATTPELPEGEYAIVEMMGHRTVVGRFAEIERFGTKLMQLEPVFGDRLLEPILISGSSLYQFTPCSKAIAQKRQPTKAYNLPPAVAAVMPPELLPAPDPGPAPGFNSDDQEEDDD